MPLLCGRLLHAALVAALSTYLPCMKSRAHLWCCPSATHLLSSNPLTTSSTSNDQYLIHPSVAALCLTSISNMYIHHLLLLCLICIVTLVSNCHIFPVTRQSCGRSCAGSGHRAHHSQGRRTDKSSEKPNMMLMVICN
jgi:hypothetical protein